MADKTTTQMGGVVDEISSFKQDRMKLVAIFFVLILGSQFIVDAAKQYFFTSQSNEYSITKELVLSVTKLSENVATKDDVKQLITKIEGLSNTTAVIDSRTTKLESQVSSLEKKIDDIEEENAIVHVLYRKNK